MTSLLCQINDEGFKTKPSCIKFYGRLRDKMIQRPWTQLDEYTFVRKVTEQGFAFYGCLFNGHDLLDAAEGRQRNCWRAQSIIGVDIDHCPIHPLDMAAFYGTQGMTPWLVYRTFSDGTEENLYSYRLLWLVEVDHRVDYDQWASVIKNLSTLTPYGDKHARDASRMWQGSNKGADFHIANFEPVSYKSFKKALKKAKTWSEQ